MFREDMSEVLMMIVVLHDGKGDKWKYFVGDTSADSSSPVTAPAQHFS